MPSLRTSACRFTAAARQRVLDSAQCGVLFLLPAAWPSSTPHDSLEHMSRWGTRRGVPRHVRERIMSRDRGECQLGYLNHCTIIATEIDHVGDPHDDSDDNLRAVCSPCHRARTMQQSRAGSAASAARRAARRKLPQKPHPGDW